MKEKGDENLNFLEFLDITFLAWNHIYYIGYISKYERDNKFEFSYPNLSNTENIYIVKFGKKIWLYDTLILIVY